MYGLVRALVNMSFRFLLTIGEDALPSMKMPFGINICLGPASFVSSAKKGGPNQRHDDFYVKRLLFLLGCFPPGCI